MAGALGSTLLLGALGCANPVDGAEPSGAGAGLAATAALSFEPDSLRTGTRRTLIDGINAAENQLFTSTGRWFVSGDDGIYEIVSDAAGGYQAHAVHSGESCQFGGLTELRGALYANCYDSTNSWIFAASSSQAPDFRSIYELPGTALANGLTNDGTSLFVASSVDGTIIRLQVSSSDPLVIEARATFQAASGFLTNGIKYFDHQLYWTALFSLDAAEVEPDGTSGPTRRLGSALTFFDDLYVDDSGILVADYLNGKLVSTNPSGRRRIGTPNGTFDGPSSVLPTNGRLGLPQGALVVTERTGNRVSLFEP